MKKPVLLKDILRNLLKAYNLEKGIKQQSSVIKWSEVVDTVLKERTKAVSFRNGKLFVEVQSSTLRNELVYTKEKLKADLNRNLGEQIVKEIVLINRREHAK